MNKRLFNIIVYGTIIVIFITQQVMLWGFAMRESKVSKDYQIQLRHCIEDEEGVDSIYLYDNKNSGERIIGRLPLMPETQDIDSIIVNSPNLYNHTNK